MDKYRQDKYCLDCSALSKTSSRDSSTSISGSWGLTATPSPSRCRRPATLFSKTSRSSSKAASGPSAALKLGFSWLLSGTCTIVLRYKITIIWGQRDRYSYLYCCLWAQEHPDLFINGNNYKVISGINRNFKHLFGSLHSKGRSFTNIINGYSEILRGLILAVHTPILSWWNYSLYNRTIFIAKVFHTEFYHFNHNYQWCPATCSSQPSPQWPSSSYPVCHAASPRCPRSLHSQWWWGWGGGWEMKTHSACWSD